MKSKNIFNKDGTQRSCPHGSSVDFPCGTIHHVKIDDFNCKNCPCYGGGGGKKSMTGTFTAIICHYPNFAPQYEYSNNQT